jgi:hypothetical protein
MTKLIRAALLVLVLFVCVQAGEGIIQTGITPPPPPPATRSSEEPTVEAEDEIMYPGVVLTATELSLGLLQSLLAIF